MACARGRQPTIEDTVIRRPEEDQRPIVAALDDVLGLPGEGESSKSSHGVASRGLVWTPTIPVGVGRCAIVPPR